MHYFKAAFNNPQEQQYLHDIISLQNKNKKTTQIIKKKLENRRKIDYQNVLDQSSIVAITDFKGVITAVNDKFCQISGYSKEELIGKTHRLINSGYHNSEFFIDLWETISSKNIWTGEVKNKAKDGSFYWVHTAIIPILDDSNNISNYMAIRTDITELKKESENNFEKAIIYNSLLAKAEKLATVGTLVAGISHEVNQPLNTIKILSESMLYWQEQGKSPDLDKLYGNFKKISKEAGRISQIITHMKELALGESDDNAKTISIRDSVHGVMSLIEERFKDHNIEVNLDISEALSKINGSPIGLEQVLINLLNNAFDALSDHDTQDQKYIHISASEKNDSVVLQIENNGPPIHEHILPHIFDPFFSTKDTKNNMGVGLSVVKSILNRMGGKIQVKNPNAHPNVVFTIELPKQVQKPE